ncbi:MAG: biotin/lipoyl-binding protein, partial [Victivallales bacterium]|nr:biotin/lipoyl-binding protein [Victivallales bacterium]
MADSSNEVKNLKGKLNAMSAIMRLGHEAFRRKGVIAVGGHIVNNSRLIVRYDRSALLDMRSGKPRLISLIGQSEPSTNSEYSAQLLRLVAFFGALKEKTVVTEELLTEGQADEDTLAAFRYLAADGHTLLLLPLREPETEPAEEQLFIWVVEFFTPMPAASDAILALLSENYNEAIWSTVNARKKWFGGWFRSKGKVTPARVFQSLALFFLLALIFGRVNQNVAADFEIVPQDKQICYAPYDGDIKGLNQTNGNKVEKGNVLMTYDTDELRFKLADAQKSYDEISAKADLIRNTAFTDNTKLGDIKLLEIQKEKEKVNIEKMQWYLQRSRIIAGCD